MNAKCGRETDTSKRKEVRFILSYEDQTKKLLSKRQAVLERIESDKAEIEKINAKLNAIQLAKISDALGCDEQGLFELITKHPEQLAKLKQESTAESDTETVQGSDKMDGQTSFFDEKSNHYSET